jgi:hypothetical protein
MMWKGHASGRGRGNRVRQLIIFVLMISWLLISTACVGPLQQWGEETTFHPKAASFDPATLKQEQVAVLSAMVGFGLEGYAHQTARSLASALTQTRVPIKSLTVQDTLNRINIEGLAGEYAGMVSTYVRTGILDRVELEKIGRALHVTYVFQPSLASFSQSMSSRLSILGLRILQTRVTALRLTLQLWDTRTGEIVWESSGEATLAGEDVRESRIPFDEIARRLWGHLLDDLFTSLPVT